MKCTLHFATKLSSRDIKKCNIIVFGLLWLVTNQVISLMNGCQNLHSCTYIMTLTLMKSVQSQEEDVPRAHPLRVEFKYTARGHAIMCNCDSWEGVWKVWGRSNLQQKRSTVLPEPKLGPPPHFNKKNSWIHTCLS